MDPNAFWDILEAAWRHVPDADTQRRLLTSKAARDRAAGSEWTDRHLKVFYAHLVDELKARALSSARLRPRASAGGSQRDASDSWRNSRESSHESSDTPSPDNTARSALLAFSQHVLDTVRTLDGPAITHAAAHGAWSSDDGFLFSRGWIVAAGREYYATVCADPCLAPATYHATGEGMLDAGVVAYDDLYGRGDRN